MLRISREPQRRHRDNSDNGVRISITQGATSRREEIFRSATTATGRRACQMLGNLQETAHEIPPIPRLPSLLASNVSVVTLILFLSYPVLSSSSSSESASSLSTTPTPHLHPPLPISTPSISPSQPHLLHSSLISAPFPFLSLHPLECLHT